jgi:hypothetical protein
MGYEHVSNRPVCHLFWSDRSPDERTILLRIEGHVRLSPLVHRSFTRRQRRNRAWIGRYHPLRVAAPRAKECAFGSIPSPIAGCPISRSFFARCGMPRAFPRAG